MSSARPKRVFLLLALIGANLLVVASSGYSLVRSRQHYEQKAELITQNIANAMDQSISGSIQKIDLMLRAVADELERQIAAGGVDDPEQGLIVTKPLLGKISNHHVILFARRCSDPQGRFAGVTYATIAVDHYYGLMSQFDVGKNGIAALRDSDLGLITRRPRLDEQSGGQIGGKGTSPELTQSIGSGALAGTYHTRQSPDHVERTYSFRRLHDAPMLAFVGAANRDYLSDWREEAIRNAVIALGFMILSLVSGGNLFRLLRQTERREEALQENERELIRAKSAADAASLAKSRFLATMSHEIRTPMNGILGMAQLPMTPDLPAAERNDYVQVILNSGQTLLTLLNDILDLSKIEADKLELDDIVFSPHDVVHECQASFAKAAADPGPHQAAAPALDAVRAGERRILVVEDNATNRMVIAAMLKKLGLAFVTAGNGQEALDLILTEPLPDLILMDCQMPVMDGWETTRRIRAWERQNARPRLPIVALTAGAFEEDRDRCLAAGMDDFLTKPLVLRHLAATLESWVKPPA